MRPQIETNLKPLFDENCALISHWIDTGRLPPVDPRHLIFSIWASTQHYADFELQVGVLMGGAPDTYETAAKYLEHMFRSMLTTR